MNWKCDLYCYESDEGFVTHVASKRRVGYIPELDWSGANSLFASYDAQQLALDNSELITIGLPEDGKSFVDYDVEDFIVRLLYLKELGYIFPEELLNGETYEEE